ncbi:MAG: filamentous hemagglutinin N-terminal domain-containing protein [Candidatus Omnitrophota bacterium]
MNRFFRLCFSIIFLLFAVYSPAMAVETNELPTGGEIIFGAGLISSSASQMTINQYTDRMAANWSTFNVGSGAAVQFVQPSTSSVSMNRILDASPSQIMGRLSANGQVFLINAAGIIFGSSAQIDVGGLVASSLDISNEQFMTGNFVFQNKGTASAVMNQGRIVTADGGYVAFLSPVVENTGDILSPDGRVLMAAADKVSLDFSGDQLVNFNVEQGAVDALAQNNGLIKADNGLVVMTAKAADDLTSAVVNNNGVIEATGLVQQGGRILLDAGDHGRTTVTGTLDVSSDTAAGGRVVVTGDDVLIDGESRLLAQGATGGGEIYVGGGWQGADASIRNATKDVAVLRGALLNANATDSGNAGTVVVWSNGRTFFSGSILARGGLLAGDGGKVEVSGKENLGFFGAADLKASNGKDGLILLDPNDITIVDGSDGQTGVYANWSNHDDGGNYVIPETVLEALTGDVILTATNNIRINHLTTDGELTLQATSISFFSNDESSPSSAGGFTMDVLDTINLLGAGNLTLQGGSQAGPSNTYSIYAGNLLTHGGNVIFNTKRSSAALPIRVLGTITTNGGSVSVTPGTRFALANSSVVNVQLDGLVSTSGGSFTSNMTGTVQVNGGMSLGAGTATFGGTGTQINSLISSTADVTIAAPLTFGTGSGITTTGTVTFNETAAMASAGADLTLTANNFLFNNTFTGNGGSITLKPYNVGTTVDVGGAGTGTMLISSAALGQLSGFGHITIGRNDATSTTKVVGNTSLSASSVFELINDTIDVTAGTLTNTGGDVTLTGNNVNVTSIVTANGGTGKITLQQLTAANTITLGAALNPTLGLFNASTLAIGREDGGNVTFDSDMSTTASTVHIRSGGTVTASAGGVAAANLAVTAGGGATLTDSTFSFTNLALKVGGDTTVTRSSSDFSIASVDGVNGVVLNNTATAAVTLNTITSGSITLNAPITKTEAGTATVSLKAVGNVTINSNMTSSSGALNLVLNADTDTVAGGGIIINAGKTITTAGGNIVMGGGVCTSTSCSAAAIATGVAGDKGINIAGTNGSPVTINSNGGLIWMWGQGGTNGGSGLSIGYASIDTAVTGSMTMRGDGWYVLTDGGNGNGVLLSNSTLHAGSGGLSLTGNASVNNPGSGQWSTGFNIQDSSAYTTDGGLLSVAASANQNNGNNAMLSGNGTLGHATLQNGNITITTSGSCSANNALPAISVAAGNLTVNTSASGGSLTQSAALTVAGTTTLTAGTDNDITLSNVSNDFTGAVSVVSGNNVSLVDANAMTLGAVNANAIIDVATLTDDLTLTGSIATADTSVSAAKLNAGKNMAAGTSTGGNIIVSGGTITTGAGGRVTLYSGSVSGSTGLTDLVTAGSGHFRYNSDEVSGSSNFVTPLDAGKFAIYREQPAVTVTANDLSKEFDGVEFSGGNGATGGSTLLNGDALSSAFGGTLSYSGSSQGATHVGVYTITPGGYTSLLGYAFSYVNGTLTIIKNEAVNHVHESIVGIMPTVEGIQDNASFLGGMQPEVSASTGSFSLRPGNGSNAIDVFSMFKLVQDRTLQVF